VVGKLSYLLCNLRDRPLEPADAWQKGLLRLVLPVADPRQDFVIVVNERASRTTEQLTFSGAATIGRSEECDVRLLHPLVSRRHAAVSRETGRFIIADLGSRNGVTVNGVHLAGGRIESAEQRILLVVGPYTLRVIAAETAEADEETITDGVAALGQRVELDPVARALRVDGVVAASHLTPHEYAFLSTLLQGRGIVPTTAVADAIWGTGQWDRYMLYNLVRRLRRKIESTLGTEQSVLISVPGVGYRLG
jgi:DNA-binding response OmpR family regulator